MATSLGAMAMERGFKKWDQVSKTILKDFIKAHVTKAALSIKTVTEQNCRTDSNLLDAMIGLNNCSAFTKPDFDMKRLLY